MTVALLMALVVNVLSGRGYAMDTLLGALAHSALALGLVPVPFISAGRLDLMAYPFVVILAVSRAALLLIHTGPCRRSPPRVSRWSLSPLKNTTST